MWHVFNCSKVILLDYSKKESTLPYLFLFHAELHYTTTILLPRTLTWLSQVLLFLCLLLFQVVGSTNIFYASERSEVNPITRQMTLETTNLTYGHVIAVDERLCYQPHPEDNSKTLLKQEAVVTVRGIPLSSYVENMLTSKISHNAGKVKYFVVFTYTVHS